MMKRMLILIIIGLTLSSCQLFTEAIKDNIYRYETEETLKEYSYGNYQDKGLPKNKEINMISQSYVKRKNSTIVDINEYLRNLRKGVDR